MNARMWEHPATQANVRVLAERGVELVGPDEGDLAEGERGLGRMASPRRSSRASRSCSAAAGTLAGKRVLVSAGGTREPLDAVRFVGNRSSGRMGVALADEARPPRRRRDPARGEPRRSGARGHRRRADADRGRPRARGARPAPTPTSCSWPPRSPTTGRPSRATDKRSKDGRRWTLELEPTATCCGQLGEERANGQVLVGFAAETGEGGLERAREKLARKQVDLIVYNDVVAERHRLRQRATTRS